MKASLLHDHKSLSAHTSVADVKITAASGGRIPAELVLVAPEDGSYRKHAERFRS